MCELESKLVSNINYEGFNYLLYNGLARGQLL